MAAVLVVSLNFFLKLRRTKKFRIGGKNKTKKLPFAGKVKKKEKKKQASFQYDWHFC